MRSGQIRRHDVIHASLFRVGDYDQYLEKLTLYELVIVRRKVGKKTLTLYDILRYGERQDWYSSQFTYGKMSARED